MKSSNFIFLLFGIAFVSCQQDSADNDSDTSNDSKEKNSKSKISSSSAKSVSADQQEKTDFLVTPDDKLVFNLRHPTKFYPGSSDTGFVPPLRFSSPGNFRQNFFLSDGTGRYNVQLQGFHQRNPSHFNTAVGAVSAHILNQRTNQEYIPYPPNGDPYNYPDYRGHPQATEPPVVRAYETASNANYGTHPSEYSSRRLFPNNGYHLAFTNQFDNFGYGFYNNPYFFGDGGFYQGFRRSDSLNHPEDTFYEQRNFRRPIKRFV